MNVGRESKRCRWIDLHLFPLFAFYCALNGLYRYGSVRSCTGFEPLYARTHARTRALHYPARTWIMCPWYVPFLNASCHQSFGELKQMGFDWSAFPKLGCWSRQGSPEWPAVISSPAFPSVSAVIFTEVCDLITGCPLRQKTNQHFKLLITDPV